MSPPAAAKIDQVQYSSDSSAVLCTIQATNGVKFYGIGANWDNSTEEQLRERAYEAALAHRPQLPDSTPNERST